MITIEMAKALSKFQSICPEINLDGKVSFGKTDFRYATLPNIITKTRKPLEEAGLVVSQPMIGGKIHTVLVCIADGSVLTSEMDLPERTKLQDTGGDITYLRRYMYVSMLGIVGEEDKDAENMEPIKPSKKKMSKDLLEKAKARIKAWEVAVVERLNEFFELTTEQVIELQSVDVDS